MATVIATQSSRINIEAYRGADSPIEYTVLDSAGDAFDFTGYTVTFEVVDPETGASLVRYTTADNISIALNVITLTIGADETENLKREKYSVRFPITSPSGAKSFWFIGDLDLKIPK